MQNQTMESLVRRLIGFVLIYQLLSMADCKVIKKRDRHEKEISASEVSYETTYFNHDTIGPQAELNKTSINYGNATQASSSGSDVNSLTHMPEFDGRSLKKLKSVVHGVKRSFKKVFHAWTYYGPEVGLCSCLFKFAWVTYPVVPEVTYAAMGRARRMVNGFMHDFMQGFKQEMSHDHHRISSKVAQTTADDYFDYQSNQVYPSRRSPPPPSPLATPPFRRVGNYADNLPENVPLIEKSTIPQLQNVVDMLANLQPKANATEFGIRLARHLKSQPRKPNNAQQFRYVSDDGDDIKYFAKNHNGDAANTTKSKVSDTNNAEGRAFSPNVPPIGPKPIDRIFSHHSQGPPKGLPTLNNLPPADYTYFKHGVYHHVHDLRKVKGSYPHKESHGHGHKGGWLSFDFEEAIMNAFGLVHPGRSSLPSVAKCSKIYLFQAILRFFQKTLIGL